MTHRNRQNPPSRTAPGLARFQRRAPTNCRLALELITNPSLPDAPEPDLQHEISALLQESAVLVVALAQAAETFAIQRRLMEEVGSPVLDISQARLQKAAAAIARRLLVALADAGRPGAPEPGLLDEVLDHADGVVVRALQTPSVVCDGLPAAIAAAIARALSVDPVLRPRATGPVVEAAGSAIALFVLVGIPTTFDP